MRYREGQELHQSYRRPMSLTARASPLAVPGMDVVHDYPGGDAR